MRWATNDHPTKYTGKGERRSISRKYAVLADIAATKLSALEACQLHRLVRSTCMGARGNSANQIHHACLSSLNRIRVIPHLPNGELQTGDTVAAPPRCG